MILSFRKIICNNFVPNGSSCAILKSKFENFEFSVGLGRTIAIPILKVLCLPLPQELNTTKESFKSVRLDLYGSKLVGSGPFSINWIQWIWGVPTPKSLPPPTTEYYLTQKQFYNQLFLWKFFSRASLMLGQGCLNKVGLRWGFVNLLKWVQMWVKSGFLGAKVGPNASKPTPHPLWDIDKTPICDPV